MGKDLKGKELGAGIIQRKDGKYAAGMKQKTLQEILGHANIGVTMNLYVHITENGKEIKKFEQAFKIG